MSQVDERLLLPLPLSGVSHAVVFFEALPKSVMTGLLELLREDYPLLNPLDPNRWGAASEPRPITFGELEEQAQEGRASARWHLLIDAQGVAPEVIDAVHASPQSFDERLAGQMAEAGASVLVFLLDDGVRPSTPLSKLRALCRPVWRLLEMGGLGVTFPEGGTMLSADTLKLIRPDELDAGRFYLTVSSGLAERREGLLWFRTYGMAGYGLPDLCTKVVSAQEKDLEDALLKVRTLLETLPAEMVAQGGVLPLGGEVAVGDRTFRAVAPPEEPLTFRSRFGFSHLE